MQNMPSGTYWNMDWEAYVAYGSGNYFGSIIQDQSYIQPFIEAVNERLGAIGYQKLIIPTSGYRSLHTNTALPTVSYGDVYPYDEIYIITTSNNGLGGVQNSYNWISQQNVAGYNYNSFANSNFTSDIWNNYSRGTTGPYSEYNYANAVAESGISWIQLQHLVFSLSSLFLPSGNYANGMQFKNTFYSNTYDGLCPDINCGNLQVIPASGTAFNPSGFITYTPTFSAANYGGSIYNSYYNPTPLYTAYSGGIYYTSNLIDTSNGTILFPQDKFPQPSGFRRKFPREIFCLDYPGQSGQIARFVYRNPGNIYAQDYQTGQYNPPFSPITVPSGIISGSFQLGYNGTTITNPDYPTTTVVSGLYYEPTNIYYSNYNGAEFQDPLSQYKIDGGCTTWFGDNPGSLYFGNPTVSQNPALSGIDPNLSGRLFQYLPVSGWVLNSDQTVDPDIVTGYGLALPGDYFGPWILNDLRNAINQLVWTLGSNCINEIEQENYFDGYFQYYYFFNPLSYVGQYQQRDYSLGQYDGGFPTVGAYGMAGASYLGVRTYKIKSATAQFIDYGGGSGHYQVYDRSNNSTINGPIEYYTPGTFIGTKENGDFYLSSNWNSITTNVQVSGFINGFGATYGVPYYYYNSSNIYSSEYNGNIWGGTYVESISSTFMSWGASGMMGVSREIDYYSVSKYVPPTIQQISINPSVYSSGTIFNNYGEPIIFYPSNSGIYPYQSYPSGTQSTPYTYQLCYLGTMATNNDYEESQEFGETSHYLHIGPLNNFSYGYDYNSIYAVIRWDVSGGFQYVN